MATRKPKHDEASLPFAALQLLAPPVRLVSAALWKVMKQRDVMQYGVLEEFVTSACETVPGLLTVRHQAKLALGLRGRYILELCLKQPDEKVIMANLERIRAPAALTLSSAATLKRDVKIVKTAESFHSLVHTLLTDTEEREHFLREEFPMDYGPEFDRELEKLLWEFLIRLDQLLPVPNLAQTVSWLSDAPPVLEECARAATQPQLLKILLQHQTCLGHLETAASLPPNMGDSILDSLSLPPSGRISSKQTPEEKIVPNSTQTQDKTPFITPVLGLISNEDIPVMISASKRTQSGDELAFSEDAANKHSKFTAVKQRETSNEGGVNEEEQNGTTRSNAMKRKQPDRRDSWSEEEEEEEEVLGVTRSRKKRMSGSLRSEARIQGKRKDAQKTKESQEDGANTQDQNAFVSCRSYQPRVVIHKLPDGTSSEIQLNVHKLRKSPVKAGTSKNTRNHPEKPDWNCSGLTDKENHPLTSVSMSPSLPRSNTERSSLSGDAEDYVADSEDEATKNFKGRLFMKRYYKTKHGTYVPTLREYRKPGMTPRYLSLAPSKRR